MDDERNGLVGVDEVAKFLDVSKWTIYQWVHQERIPVVKLSNLIRFDLTEIEKWVKQKTRTVRQTKEVRYPL